MSRSPRVICLPSVDSDFAHPEVDHACYWEIASWPPESVISIPSAWARSIEVAAKELRVNGYSVVDATQVFRSGLSPGLVISQLLSIIAEPIRVFRHLPLWRAVDVDFTRPTNSSRGVGYLPMHIDFVNAENPPDYVALVCLEPDPHGGGFTILANVEGITSALSPASRGILKAFTFNEGKVVDLDNVGSHRLFQVISDSDRFPLRYTEKLLQQICSSEAKAALKELNTLIGDRKITFPLKKHHMLVADQRKILHGREQLAQRDGEFSAKRLLMQLFLRERNDNQSRNS